MTQLNDEQRAAILDAIRSGRKIEAIKLYRDDTGQGLKEAKDFIEELTAQLRRDDPDFVETNKAGCGTAVLMAVAACAATMTLFTI